MSHTPRRNPPPRYKASLRKRRKKRRIYGILFASILFGSIILGIVLVVI